MSEMTAAPSPAQPPRRRRNRWNVLLLVPLLMLVTPWINMVEPRLFGMPFFYWIQFAWVAAGVACVAIVNATESATESATENATEADHRWTGDRAAER